MRILNPDFLKSCHAPGPCECCGKWCQEREPHHLWGRGAGRQLDDPHFVVMLGHTQSFQCPCHSRHQEGGLESRDMFLAIIAARQGVTCAATVEAQQFIYRLPKGTTCNQAWDAWQLSEYTIECWNIARMVLVAMPDQARVEKPLRKRKKRKPTAAEAARKRRASEALKATYRALKAFRAKRKKERPAIR